MLSKLVRIGRDAELRHTQSGTAVLSFPAVYDIGYGDNKKGQWIDCAMFGQRAEKLSTHFTKGKQIVIHADDVELDQFQKNDGTQGAKLKCKIVDFDFAGGQQKGQQHSSPMQQAPQQQAAPQQQYQPQQQPAPQHQYNEPPMDFDDDIPFAPIGLSHNNNYMHCI